jgi:hypothetical protein
MQIFIKHSKGDYFSYMAGYKALGNDQYHQMTSKYLVDLLDDIKHIENEDPVDTNILLSRSYLLYKLNLKYPALNQLTSITRKTKNTPQELMIDIRYLRGRMYDEVGEKSKAQKDYQYIFGKTPDSKTLLVESPLFKLRSLCYHIKR